VITSDTGPGTLLAGDSMEYRLGRQLAEGGEGVVFRLQDRDDVVAKLYKEWQAGRDEKLARLIDLKNKRLTKIAAWPLSQLRNEVDEPIGFVMERLEGWQPLHAVYQIKSRLEVAPTRTYQYLVRTARNLAACVHQVHEAGLVIGDLNESNVFVGSDAMVKLIDVDSFQLKDGDRIFPCKVGKAELMPPELQNISLEGVERTKDHDRFALAVLIFHLLVFGRHPFAGRPKADLDIPLEESIRLGYYAFTERRDVPVVPPPHLNLDWLPLGMRELFEDAFDPNRRVRPDAQVWFDALKGLEDELTGCDLNGGHAYWRGARDCPWCHLEERWNVALFVPTYGSPAFEAESSLDELGERLRRLPAPRAVEPPMMDYQNLEPAKMSWWERAAHGGISFPLPFWILLMQLPNLLRNYGYIILAVFIPFVLVAAFVWQRGHVIRSQVKKSEKALEEIWQRWKTEADVSQFDARREELEKVRQALSRTGDRLAEARVARIRELHKDDLGHFLGKYSVLAADVGPVGSSRLSYLYDRGFRTAADITEESVLRTKDLDEAFWRDLRAWRHTLEEQFWKAARFSLPAAQEQQVLRTIHKENAQYREILRHAEDDLSSMYEQLTRRQSELVQEAQPYVQQLQEFGPQLLAIEGRKA